MGNNYYLKLFLEEWKYIFIEKKIRRCINDNLEISSDDSAEETSDEQPAWEHLVINGMVWCPVIHAGGGQ